MARKKKKAPIHHCVDCGKKLKGHGKPERCKSCNARRQWESEEHRRQVSKKAKKRMRTPEGRRQASEQAKKQWESEEFQRERSGGAKKQWEPGGSLDHLRGSKSPSWRGGTSFEPYGPEFSEKLKKSIRERDGNTCAICGEPGNQVHHIDYDKRNNSSDNLITLCVSCHSKTGGRRKYWERRLKRMKK